MTAATLAGQKQGSWRQLGFGLAAFLMLPLIPIVRSIVPIEQTLLLIVPVVAVCALVGWKLGGRAGLALVWLVLAVWVVLQHAGPAGSPYDRMARGWTLLLAASFGTVSLLSVATPFFVRALARDRSCRRGWVQHRARVTGRGCPGPPRCRGRAHTAERRINRGASPTVRDPYLAGVGKEIAEPRRGSGTKRVPASRGTGARGEPAAGAARPRVAGRTGDRVGVVPPAFSGPGRTVSSDRSRIFDSTTSWSGGLPSEPRYASFHRSSRARSRVSTCFFSSVRST